jgi:hypothetical protein
MRRLLLRMGGLAGSGLDRPGRWCAFSPNQIGPDQPPIPWTKVPLRHLAVRLNRDLLRQCCRGCSLLIGNVVQMSHHRTDGNREVRALLGRKSFDVVA